ncbi:hypothetical protein PSH28_26640 [Pseudomonas resinovorans]|uniref:hypothetical protein n=1 Tax=Metapseudomonas resinovorans TaxID=53412 RepID=UPI00237FA8DB|nr:hypothetical protein [Pseudomonas resinovorans]MDE3740194.1 hypothetical protein [Pseudomonas resinovorans]
MASHLTKVYPGLKPYRDNEALQRIKEARNPLACARLLTVDSRQAYLAMIPEATCPAIVTASDGMCSSGRIANYLKAMLRDSAEQRPVRWLPGPGHYGASQQNLWPAWRLCGF